MGLTIHYTMTTNLREVADVRALVETLRQYAGDLPFAKVGKLIEFQGAATSFETADRDDPDAWLKLQAGQLVEIGSQYMRVEPRHILAFRTSPGEGSEPANFGFCRYPATVPVTDKDGAHRLATQLRGWSWKSFCKTQYASSPNCGGVQNFLRCHLAIVKLLDFAKATGLVEVEVHDEGGYWEARSVERLVQKIGQWNEFVAAVAGMMKDAAQAGGMAVEAAITGFPNFEHLEAKGREHLAKFHQQRKKPTD